jgi:hypothetical protein
MANPYWKEEHWKRYRYKELEATIKDNPITKEKLLNLISTSYIGVSYPFYSSKDIGLSCYYGCQNKNFFPNYQIDLNRGVSRNKQINTFAHELIHIFYRCGFSSSESKEGLRIEDLIEKESVLLASKHRPLLISILDSLPTFYSLHPNNIHII